MTEGGGGIPVPVTIRAHRLISYSKVFTSRSVKAAGLSVSRPPYDLPPRGSVVSFSFNKIVQEPCSDNNYP